MPGRRAWYGSPLRRNWRRPVLDVSGGEFLGDTLLITPAVRALKRRRPGCRVRVYTNYPTLVAALPYIDEVLPVAAAPAAVLKRHYGALLSFPMHLFHLFGGTRAVRLPVPLARAHLAQLAADVLGVPVADVRPDCIVRPDLVALWRELWHSLPRPHIIVSRQSSGGNRDWPDAYWDVLIARLARVTGVIETGVQAAAEQEQRSGNYADLRGRTTIEEFVAAIAAADLHIGPISGPVHVAAAVGTPCVVIYGGYEPPSNTHYPDNIALHTSLRCAPCWLWEPCPYDRTCLRQIAPDSVEATVWRLWRRQSIRDEPRPPVGAGPGEAARIRAP